MFSISGNENFKFFKILLTQEILKKIYLRVKSYMVHLGKKPLFDERYCLSFLDSSFFFLLVVMMASLVAQMVKNPPATIEDMGDAS